MPAITLFKVTVRYMTSIVAVRFVEAMGMSAASLRMDEEPNLS